MILNASMKRYVDSNCDDHDIRTKITWFSVSEILIKVCSVGFFQSRTKTKV